MKRLRLQRWSGQLLSARSAARSTPCRPQSDLCRASIRHQSSAATADIVYEDSHEPNDAPKRPIPESDTGWTYPSPLPEKALTSAKLAALHARLSLSQKIPLQTLARTLVDRTADANPAFNNANLALLGYTLINYHAGEWLMCRHPRLPMLIMYAAMRAYCGDSSLHRVARQWGVEVVAAPGDEVDPGLLQFRWTKDRPQLKRWGYTRPESNLPVPRWRRGISSRVVMDDDFGDMVPDPAAATADADADADVDALLPARDLSQVALAAVDPEHKRKYGEGVHADFVRAVVGALYAHCGREPAKAFVRAHVLSRYLDLAALFKFRLPTRELALLCQREGFEPPVARLLSETGRASRTPVFVVGIYSGNDKLGEGADASLDGARHKAAMNALKAWYLYSPGDNVRMPSEMLVEGAKPWEPAYVDIGEIS